MAQPEQFEVVELENIFRRSRILARQTTLVLRHQRRVLRVQILPRIHQLLSGLILLNNPVHTRPRQPQPARNRPLLFTRTMTTDDVLRVQQNLIRRTPTTNRRVITILTEIHCKQPTFAG